MFANIHRPAVPPGSELRHPRGELSGPRCIRMILVVPHLGTLLRERASRDEAQAMIDMAANAERRVDHRPPALAPRIDDRLADVGGRGRGLAPDIRPALDLGAEDGISECEMHHLGVEDLHGGAILGDAASMVLAQQVVGDIITTHDIAMHRANGQVARRSTREHGDDNRRFSPRAVFAQHPTARQRHVVEVGRQEHRHRPDGTLGDSMPRRFLLATLGTLGDVIPFVRLARELIARGHHVTVHSWEQFASWFPPGARFVSSGGSVDATELATMMDEALRATTHVEQMTRFAETFYGLGGVERARAHLSTVREALAGQDFAIINVLDHVAQLAASDMDVPWASYASRPPPDPAQADAMNTAIDDALSDLLATVTGRTRRVRTFREWSSRLAFAACAPELTPATITPAVERTGAWLERAASVALPSSLEDFVAAGPCLFATFGTMPDINGRTAALIAAAANAGWRAIVQVLAPAALPDSLPDGILVLRDRVSFDALVPRVAAVVHHGSVGTLHEIVRAGKPSFAVAHMGDQFFWAQVLYERRLGPSPLRSSQIDVKALSVRMDSLRDPNYQRAVERLAPVIAARDGVVRAIERLEAVTLS